MGNKETIESLFKEKDIARQEIFLGLKTINQVSLILLPFFFSSIGLLFGLIKDVTITPEKLVLVLKIISQVIFLLWMFGLSILCSVAALTGYVQALEEKINQFFAVEVTGWESIVAERYLLKYKSGQFISTFLWNSFYLLGFISLAFEIRKIAFDNLFFVINLLETFVIVLLFYLVLRARKRSYSLMRFKK